MSEIAIPTDDVRESFGSFLEIPQNSRILFSGPFGIGKTHFLKDFFELNSQNYDVYHLFPVNYQIHPNDDVIDLIKYDLVVELSGKNKEIFENKSPEGIKESSLLFFSWVKENYSLNQALFSAIDFGEYLSGFSGDPFISFLGKLGKPLQSLLAIDAKFQNFKKEYKTGQRGLIDKFEASIRSKRTSETDYISAILKEKITQNKSSKKSILILDDLDRVDPDHIFRILNILSSHFERDGENKFGFDKVIVVADYSNIKHIFYHRYGAKTDFSGYIDKFYTVTPFYFDNKKAVVSKVNEIVRNIKNSEPQLAPAIGEGGYIKLFLQYIFLQAIDNEIINLRQLLKATNYELVELKKGGYYQDRYGDSNENFLKVFDIAVKIAIHSFSNTEIFIEKIKFLKEQNLKKDRRIPFDIYIRAMLRGLGEEIPDHNAQFDMTWGNYHVKNSENGFTALKVEGDREVQMFYDLLIAYVTNKKHLPDEYVFAIRGVR